MGYTKEIGLKDFYDLYEQVCTKRNKHCVDRRTYGIILKEFNLEIRNRIIYKSERITLPYKLGDLYIRKFENTYTEDNKKNWAIDFKKTKELGHVVYHGAKYGYRWRWEKRKCIVRGKSYFRFKPCRTSSRMIADAIKNKHLDYYN